MLGPTFMSSLYQVRLHFIYLSLQSLTQTRNVGLFHHHFFFFFLLSYSLTPTSLLILEFFFFLLLTLISSSFFLFPLRLSHPMIIFFFFLLFLSHPNLKIRFSMGLCVVCGGVGFVG